MNVVTDSSHLQQNGVPQSILRQQSAQNVAVCTLIL